MYSYSHETGTTPVRPGETAPGVFDPDALDSFVADDTNTWMLRVNHGSTRFMGATLDNPMYEFSAERPAAPEAQALHTAIGQDHNTVSAGAYIRMYDELLTEAGASIGMNGYATRRDEIERTFHEEQERHFRYLGNYILEKTGMLWVKVGEKISVTDATGYDVRFARLRGIAARPTDHPLKPVHLAVVSGRDELPKLLVRKRPNLYFGPIIDSLNQPES